MSAERQFEAIAQATISQAAAVKCSVEEYREGLRLIIEECRIAISASEETDG